jgi:hypothetical protein
MKWPPAWELASCQLSVVSCARETVKIESEGMKLKNLHY